MRAATIPRLFQLAVVLASVVLTANAIPTPVHLPPQTVVTYSLVLYPCPNSHVLSQLVDLQTSNVLGQTAIFRTDTFGSFFNPTNSTPPFFQAFHPSFLDLLGPSPSIRSIASDPTFAFAHEGPVWLKETNEVVFASYAGGTLGRSGLDANNQVAKIRLGEVEEQVRKGVKEVNVTV